MKFLKVILIILVIMGLYRLQNNSEIRSHKTPRLVLKAELIEHLVLGFKMIAADMLWLRFIQEIDYHESEKVNLGWSYHLAETITQLDPRYRIVYISSGTVLSVLIRDIEGARRIWERAITYFPHDWSILYRAGYHELYEVKNCKRAAELFALAGKEGAPTWAMALAAKLYRKTGNYDLARAVVSDALEKFGDTPLKDLLLERLKEIDSAEQKQNSSLDKDTPIIESCKPSP